MDIKFVNELRELEKKATPGEWAILGRNHEGKGTGIKSLSVPNATIAVPCTECLGMEWENAKLIVALRNSLPQILALAEENERLRKIVGAGEEFEKSVDVVLRDGTIMDNECCEKTDEALRRYREAIEETKE